MNTAFWRASATVFLTATLSASAWCQAFSESFANITQLASNGWVMTNASVPAGTTNWFQGSPGPFDAHSAPANAYIAANYNNTGTNGTISNWLMMPNRTLRNGDVLTFYTRKASPDTYPDRLEVRLSTNGASTGVGSSAGVGDFTTLLLSINPSLTLGVYPTTWTQYSVTLSGLPAPTSGRMAFRYYVTGAGLSGANSDYIGIDDVIYTPYVCPALSVTGTPPSGAKNQAYSAALGQTGALGVPAYAITAGALPAGLSLSSSGTISGTPTATGTFNFTVTVSDNSGCSGSQAYALTVNAGEPLAPQNAGALAGQAQASVSWTAPADDGGSPITGYTVTAVEDTSKTCTTTGALSCTVPGLSNGTSYSFSVVATNAIGSSPAAISNAVVPQGAQTISFANPGTQTVGTTLNLSASASSGLAVSFTAAGDCSLSGSTLSFSGAGNCTVTAEQAGNAAWLPAAAVVQSFAVAQPAAVPMLGHKALAMLAVLLLALGVTRRRVG